MSQHWFAVIVFRRMLQLFFLQAKWHQQTEGHCGCGIHK